MDLDLPSFIYKTVQLFVQSEYRNITAGQMQSVFIDRRPLSFIVYTLMMARSA